MGVYAPSPRRVKVYPSEASTRPSAYSHHFAAMSRAQEEAKAKLRKVLVQANVDQLCVVYIMDTLGVASISDWYGVTTDKDDAHRTFMKDEVYEKLPEKPPGLPFLVIGRLASSWRLAKAAFAGAAETPFAPSSEAPVRRKSRGFIASSLACARLARRMAL